MTEAEVPHRGSIGAHLAMAGRPSKPCRQVGFQAFLTAKNAAVFAHTASPARKNTERGQFSEISGSLIMEYAS